MMPLPTGPLPTGPLLMGEEANVPKISIGTASGKTRMAINPPLLRAPSPSAAASTPSSVNASVPMPSASISGTSLVISTYSMTAISGAAISIGNALTSQWVITFDKA